MPKQIRFELRIDVQDRNAFRDAAKALKMTMAEWVIMKCKSDAPPKVNIKVTMSSAFPPTLTKHASKSSEPATAHDFQPKPYTKKQ